MPVVKTTRHKAQAIWRSLISAYNRPLERLQQLEEIYQGHKEFEQVIRMLSQMTVDAQELAKKMYHHVV